MSAGVIRGRLSRLRASSDAGVTLMELVVAMVLSVLVGALTAGIFIKVNESSANSIDRSVNTAGARNAIQDWTAYLRVADGKTPGVKTNRIEWLTSTDMLFYADLFNRSVTNLAVTGTPTMVWLRLDSTGTLLEEQFAGTAVAGTAPQVCRRLVGNVSIPSTRLFTGYDSGGESMTGQALGTAPSPVAGCVALPVTVPSQSNHPDLTAQANLQNVASVAIDFIVRDTKGKHPIEFSSQAVLPALGGV
jgi:hypothetical protein